MNHISTCQTYNLYDDLILPRGPMVQVHFDDLHLLLYLIQHINIITNQYHHDGLITYNELMHNNLNQTNANLTICTHFVGYVLYSFHD